MLTRLKQSFVLLQLGLDGRVESYWDVNRLEATQRNLEETGEWTQGEDEKLQAVTQTQDKPGNPGARLLPSAPPCRIYLFNCLF